MDVRFRYHLCDTLTLLGCKTEVVELLRNPDQFDDSALSMLRQYNIELVTDVKDRLVNLNKMEVHTGRRLGWQSDLIL